MITFLTILGIILLLFLINYVMHKLFKASGVLRFLVIAGLILLLLGVYSLPYIAINWTSVLIILGFILLVSFIIFLLSKFITPGIIKFLIVLSVVLLLFSIFLVSFTTFKADKENNNPIVKNTKTDNFYKPNERLGFNPGYSINQLDSITAKNNKNFTYARDISPSDLPIIQRRNRIGS